MEKNGDLRRRIVNAAVAVAAFFTVFALSYLLTVLISSVLKTEPSSLPFGVVTAVWAASLGAGCVFALAFVRPLPAPEFPADVVPRRTEKRAFLVPVSVFLLLAVNVIISLSGSGNTEVPSYTAREFDVRAALGCTVYPILEETFFRGVLLGALRERDDPLVLRLAAVAVTAVAFAATHREGGFVFSLAAGFILAVPAPYGLTEGRRSAIPFGAIAAHALYNLALYVSLAIMMTGFEPVIPLAVFAGVAAVTAGIMMLVGGKDRWKEKKKSKE